MASASLWIIWTLVLMALAFDYINGFHDTANSIATTVLTGALSIPWAILLAASLNFLGAFMSKAVATTIGKGIVDPSKIDMQTVMAALVGAIIWNLVTWWQGLPSSSSHALIGGIVGAVAARHGFGNFEMDGLKKIGIALLISPILGFLVGHLMMVATYWIFRHTAPTKINRWFKFIQVLSASSMAISHGGNDAQKTMGLITMALVAGGFVKQEGGHFPIPFWVVASCATAMALGTAGGGWRIIKTVGRKVLALQPVHGFAAETSGAAVIFAATAMGAPVSTTHVISSSIMGVGSAQGLNRVRWNVVRQIVSAWILTLPASALVAAAVSWISFTVFGF
jgi:inorganic phosphate transporter, PiT family